MSETKSTQQKPYDELENPKIARKLCEQFGATDVQLADYFDISESTLYRWKIRYPEFAEAVQIGKEPADDRVEQALYNRAIGFRVRSTKFFSYEGAVISQDYDEYYPPDVKAAIFWLCNRRRDKWSNAHMKGIGFGADDETPASIEVKIVDGRAKPD